MILTPLDTEEITWAKTAREMVRNPAGTMYEEPWQWHGRIKVIITYADGSQQIDEFDNLITDAGRGLLRDTLRGAVTDAKIRYLALGTSTTAPAISDTQLGAEVFRKAVTSFTTSGNTATITNVYVAPGDAVGVGIQELGWFAGPDATTTANSGVLLARVLYAHNKTNVESIQFQRTDSF